MEIFPERLLADIERLPGGSHSYLKQVYGPEGAELRARLQRLAERLGPPMEDRAAELLGSFDNRRFFQGFAEVVTLGALWAGRWRLRALVPPGPRHELRGPAGETAVLSVMAFLHQTRPGAEDDTKERLAQALRRVKARDRFIVLIRRWLPHDFDPEPVRRAVDLWLARVARDQWQGRHAAYEDDHVSLEFALTGTRTRGRQSPLVEMIGPFYGHRTLEAVEPRVVQELDRHLAGPSRSRPLLLACVADQPWALTPGYLRDFLYGRASRIETGEGVDEVEFNEQSSVALFRDPVYSCVSGLLLVDRQPARPHEVRVRALLNPWATHPVRASALGLRAFALDEARSMAVRQETGRRAWVLRWQDTGPGTWEIG